MTIEDWREEIFVLYRHLRNHDEWPKNYEQIVTWLDEAEKDYLQEIHNLYESGAFK